MKKMLVFLLVVSVIINLFCISGVADESKSLSEESESGIYTITEGGHKFFDAIFDHDRFYPLFCDESLRSEKTFKEYPLFSGDFEPEGKTYIAFYLNHVYFTISENIDITLDEMIEKQLNYEDIKFMVIDKKATDIDISKSDYIQYRTFAEDIPNPDTAGKTFIISPQITYRYPCDFFKDIFETQDGKMTVYGKERTITNMISIYNSHQIVFAYQYNIFFTDNGEVFIRKYPYPKDKKPPIDFTWEEFKKHVIEEVGRMGEYVRKYKELYGEVPIGGGSVSDEELDRMIAELDAELEFKKNNPEASVTSSPENNSVISPDTTVDLPESDKPINLALILIPSAVGIMIILSIVFGIKTKKHR